MQDVFAHGRRRRSGQRQHRRVARAGDHAAERQIRRTEIVAPLADAVRFVDDEERHARSTCRSAEKPSSSSFSGRNEDDLDRAAKRCARARAASWSSRERRVERDDVGDAALAQHVELIFHQRDQRADDDRRALEQQRRKLIAQAFPAPVAKDRQRIFTRQERATRRLLGPGGSPRNRNFSRSAARKSTRASLRHP